VKAITRIRLEDIREAIEKVNNKKAESWQILCTLQTESQINIMQAKQLRIDQMIRIKEARRLGKKAARLKSNNRKCGNRHKCEQIRTHFREEAASKTRTQQKQQTDGQNQQDGRHKRDEHTEEQRQLRYEEPNV
jgi:hypothetical protein